jgi:NAD-dependent dihydropyrimidine dehydrogenase PreA subunit
MAYIIAEPCIGTKDTACVDACPVDCIHPKKDSSMKMAGRGSIRCTNCSSTRSLGGHPNPAIRGHLKTGQRSN